MKNIGISRITIFSSGTLFLNALVVCAQTPTEIPAEKAGETSSHYIRLAEYIPPTDVAGATLAAATRLTLAVTAAVTAPQSPVQDPARPSASFTLERRPPERDSASEFEEMAGNLAQDATAPDSQQKPKPGPDTDAAKAAKPDSPFTASAYLGVAIDTFAASGTRQYLNPNAGTGAQERAIGGFDFAYRLFGSSKATGSAPNTTATGSFLTSSQLWLYGETVYGARSAEIDCSKPPAKDLLACTGNLAAPSNPGNQLLYIVRNASSLEGFVGLRWEFLSLQPDSPSPAKLYLKAQAGFITVAGAAALKDVHHLSLGAIVKKSKYRDSYLEVGWGRNDLFQSKPRGRWKVDGYLQRRIGSTKNVNVSFFAQVLVDTDLGYGADSVQSYIGLNLGLDQLFGK